MAKKRATRKREPICTNCSHGEEAFRVENLDLIRAPAPARERYPTREWAWWQCPHCDSIWVVQVIPGAVEKHRIGFLDAQDNWHDVRPRWARG